MCSGQLPFALNCISNSGRAGLWAFCDLVQPWPTFALSFRSKPSSVPKTKAQAQAKEGWAWSMSTPNGRMYLMDKVHTCAWNNSEGQVTRLWSFQTCSSSHFI
ncbi:hypothetical protein AAC387_Pa05g1821 [Persea americana]